MPKKLASLLLSLLLCLPLLPGPPRTGSLPVPEEPPAILEPAAHAEPDEPEEPAAPMSENAPEDDGYYHTK